MKDRSPFSEGFAPFLFLVPGVLLLSLAGYSGYIVYPRFELPAVSGVSLMALAAMAGTASFFSPCSFPLLLTLLVRATNEAEGGKRLGKLMGYAVALSAGAGLFLLLAGGLLSLGAGTFFQEITFTSPAGRGIRTIVGSTLCLFGLVQLGIFPNIFDRTWRLMAPLQKKQAQLRRRKPALSFGMFGFGYVLAGFG